MRPALPTRIAATAALALSASLSAALPAQAEVTLSFYTGFQEAAHSRVRGNDGTSDFSFLSTWEGRSFEMPPYWGARAIWWRNENWGFGGEFTHTKVYASDGTLADNGLDTLEFSDGLNIVTANVMYRWPDRFMGGRLTPYVGGGLGVAVPHVEVTFSGSSDETFEYQMTGPAARVLFGASYEINDRWALFGEYQTTYSQNEADLKGGGTLETDIVTNAVNIGISYSF